MVQVILVDQYDQEIGFEEKIKAHELGLLHRAFSLFVFNQQGQLLLQRRALDKYHSGGLWTNTVCSHPKPDEDIVQGCKTRMIEEMGFSTDVQEIFAFVYRSDYENGLSEHEYDHVFVGYYDDDPVPNPEEVCEYSWKSLADIRQDMTQDPENYTTWFYKIMINDDYFQTLGDHSLLHG